MQAFDILFGLSEKIVDLPGAIYTAVMEADVAGLEAEGMLQTLLETSEEMKRLWRGDAGRRRGTFHSITGYFKEWRL